MLRGTNNIMLPTINLNVGSIPYNIVMDMNNVTCVRLQKMICSMELEPRSSWCICIENHEHDIGVIMNIWCRFSLLKQHFWLNNWPLSSFCKVSLQMGMSYICLRIPLTYLGEPTHTLIPCWMPKSLLQRNQCTGWFAPNLLNIHYQVKKVGPRWQQHFIYVSQHNCTLTCPYTQPILCNNI